MNRNVESHFALNPTSLDIPRSQFDRSSGVKFSANIGQCIPFYVDEILPGDTFKVKTSKVIRLQTLVHPIMDNIYADIYWFFCPIRLVWNHAKNFFGESAKAWTPNVEYRIPKLNITEAHPHPGQGSLCDYMGVPLGITCNTNSGANPKGGLNALPFRAYAKIMNDWFRSEVVTDELVIPDGDSDEDVNAISDADLYCAYGGPVFQAAKFHDYFTSATPAPQSGPAALIPISSQIPGIPVLTKQQYSIGAGMTAVDLLWRRGNSSGKTGTAVRYSLLNDAIETSDSVDDIEGIEFGSLVGSPGAVLSADSVVPSNLWADSSFAGTINDLRVAFQVQKFYEKMARGRRYIEVLKSQFGVTSPDARLQRTEYLGGNRTPINVSEVTNNAQTSGNPLGDLGAYSRTVDVNEDFVHSFTEHGYLFGICVLRYDHSYPQGLDKMYMRTSMFDFYWPVFANLGDQKIDRAEINYAWGSTADATDVFGYQERWAEYRYKPSRVCGELRPEASGSLASWHLSDYYDQEIPEGESGTGPYLSDSWMREDPGIVDRCLAVTSEVSNQYIADFWIQNICTRVMPMYSIPGLADHH